MTSIEKSLVEKIESAVEQIVAASHAAAVASLSRAFGRERPASVPRRSSRQRSPAESAPTPRRTQEELAALGERFLELIHEDPGQTMSVLAPQLGVTPDHLKSPVARLKNQGRLKTTGERQFTRYFPASGEPS